MSWFPVSRSSALSSAAALVAAGGVLAGGRSRSRRRDAARRHAALLDEIVRDDRREHEALAARLHDGPLQMVISARQDLQEHLAGDDVDLAQTAQALGEAVTALRDLTTDVYEDVLRDAGLEGALTRAAEVTERRGGPPIVITVGPGASGPHDALVVRVADELLTNVRKHADAGHGWVLVLRGDGQEVLLTVGDDGVGMDPDVLALAARRGHLGLRSITRRVTEAGGSVRVRPLDPGSEVEVRLPGPQRP